MACSAKFNMKHSEKWGKKGKKSGSRERRLNRDINS